MVSHNDESWVDAEQMTRALLRLRPGPPCALGFDSPRYVGARIGIFNPAGEKVGTVNRLRNTEYLFLAGEPDRVAAAAAAAEAAATPGSGSARGRIRAVTVLAITVLGHDRPGIIAETTTTLADLGLNIEDTTMTLLRGHFAMMLITAGESPAPEVEAALAPLGEDGTLSVSVRELPDEERAGSGPTYLLSVHGATARASWPGSSPRSPPSAATSPT